ncbi:MAG: acetolactate synthase small subunit [Ruminococcus sp.]|jgi:acetolactate synthase-1/3 small subunit|nr:acetolactate synthase small subunit [Ruminococcus sp.]
MKRIYSVLVENRFGVLSKIAGLFSRRGFNIASLAVGVTESPDVSRMTIVTDDESDAPERNFEQIRKQLSKMIDTIRVKALSEEECLSRELVLIKVSGDIESIKNTVKKTNTRVIDEDGEICTIEITDTPERVNKILSEFDEYELLETVRTGVISLQKGAKTLI